jgi:hypothetical protein
MTLQELSLVHVRVSVAQAFGGENDQRESSCDHRAVSRWNFAGAGAERSRNGQRTAGSRRRCGQSHSRCAGIWSPGSSRDETPQKHLHVGKEPQRLEDEYHQVVTSKKVPVGVAPASCPGRLFLNSLGRAREDDLIGDQSASASCLRRPPVARSMTVLMRGLQIRPNRLERGPRARSLKGAMR